MKSRTMWRSTIPFVTAAVALLPIPSFAASWLTTKTIDNATGKHAFENSVVKYEYGMINTGSCVLTNAEICFASGCEKFIDTMQNATVFGTGIGKFILKDAANENICGKWSGRGTGFNLCDYSKAVISDETEDENMFEYKVTQERQSRWERFYKGLAVIEQEMISTDGSFWLSDVLVVRGQNTSPVFVANGIDGITRDMAMTHKTSWNDGNVHEYSTWKNADIIYKGYAICGFIDSKTGHGTGLVVRTSSVEGGKWLVAYRYNFEPLVCIEYWDATQRAAGSKRWYFGVTGGRDEIIEVGKQIVDEGVESLLGTGIRKSSTTRIPSSFDAWTQGGRILLRVPGLQSSNVKVFDSRGMRVQSARAGGGEETAIALPGAATGIYVIQVDTGSRMLSKIVRLMR